MFYHKRSYVKKVLKPFGITAVTNLFATNLFATNLFATNLFVMMALIALAMPAGGLSAQSAVPSLDGVWQANNGHAVNINGGAAVSLQLSSGALWRDAIGKGYVKLGDQIFRNIVRGSANLQWSCQELSIEFRASAPTVATGVRWENRTITMTANGQSIQVGNTTYYRSNSQPVVSSATAAINGVWESSPYGHTFRISNEVGDGRIAVYAEISVQTRWQDAIFKGYIKVGDQKLRNLSRTGDLTWTGQDLDLTYDASAPDVATGVIWRDCTVSISADGQTLVVVTFGKDFPTVPYTRK